MKLKLSQELYGECQLHPRTSDWLRFSERAAKLEDENKLMRKALKGDLLATLCRKLQRENHKLRIKAGKGIADSVLSIFDDRGLK